MVIKAIVDRIEGGNAILLSDEIGIEISIPVEMIQDECDEGKILTVTIDGNIKYHSMGSRG